MQSRKEKNKPWRLRGFALKTFVESRLGTHMEEISTKHPCGMRVMVGFAGYFYPAIRNAEDILPDHDELPKAEAISTS